MGGVEFVMIPEETAEDRGAIFKTAATSKFKLPIGKYAESLRNLTFFFCSNIRISKDLMPKDLTFTVYP